MTDRDLGHGLLKIARAAIGAELGIGSAGVATGIASDALTSPAATFVTLRHAGELRGCIGSLEPRRPLGVDVRENAIAAAFRDPRFPPLAAREFGATSIEVSLLSSAERVEAASEQNLVALLRPGIDGLILAHGGRRATYLPQVWESFADPRAFVSALKEKAGLRADFWDPEVTVSRYTVTKWVERDFRLSEADR